MRQCEIACVSANRGKDNMSGCRIIHVEDEPDIREVVKISLALDPEITLKSCESGPDALAQAAAWSPDLILSDVMMPVMNGTELLTHLREDARTAGIPVVFMTARAQSNEVAHFISLGVAGVVAKPFDPLTLAKSVRACVPSRSRSRDLAVAGDGLY
jgi:CheY-like chemotaxis protein